MSTADTFDPLAEQIRTNELRADLRHPSPPTKTIRRSVRMSDREAADAGAGITRVEQRHHLNGDGKLRIEQRQPIGEAS
jgi:hypothetical protein